MQLGGASNAQSAPSNTSPTHVKGSDPKLRHCQTTTFLGQEFVQILLFLAGKNGIFSVKDKAQTQVQRLRQPSPSLSLSLMITLSPRLSPLLSRSALCYLHPHSLFQDGRYLLEPVPSERHLQQSCSILLHSTPIHCHD